MILSRYGSIDYILNLPFSSSKKLIEKASIEVEKEKIYRMYLVLLPKMNRSNFMSFEEFYSKNRINRSQQDNRSKEEILKELGFIKKGSEQ